MHISFFALQYCFNPFHSIPYSNPVIRDTLYTVDICSYIYSQYIVYSYAPLTSYVVLK